MKYDSIIFDLDGTLWSASDVSLNAWTKVLSQMDDVKGTLTRDDLDGIMGLSAIPLVEKLFPYLSIERGLEIFDLCCKEANSYLYEYGGENYPDVIETIKELSKTHKLAIVSNCEEGYIECYLHSTGLEDYIKDFESYGRTGKHKGINIDLVVKRNSFKKPVYVGDTVWDKESANFAGVPFIHATYGFGKINDECITIDKFKDLIKIV